MECRLLEHYLIDYLENTVSSDIRNQIDNHLKECGKCLKLYNEVKLSYSSFEGIPEINPFFYTRLEQKLRNKLRNEAPVSLWFWRFRTALAGIMMIISVGLGIYIGENITTQDTSVTSQGREEVLQSYASDYCFSATNEDNYYSYTMDE